MRRGGLWGPQSGHCRGEERQYLHQTFVGGPDPGTGRGCWRHVAAWAAASLWGRRGGVAGCPSVPPRLSAVGRGPGLGGAPLLLPPHSGGGSRHQVFPKPRRLPSPGIHRIRSSTSTSEVPLSGSSLSSVCDAVTEQGLPGPVCSPTLWLSLTTDARPQWFLGYPSS